MSSDEAELPADGLGATQLSGPDAPSASSDARAATDAFLAGRPESPDLAGADERARKAAVKARMFSGDVEAPKIGRYSILKVLGEGGMGTVYAVFDDQLDRRVALKLIKGAGTEHARQRMLREAQAMAKLSHPNVVPVFEVGQHEGQLFVAMEYVRGVTLKRWRDEDARNWREVLDKYVQAGRGLAAAHAQGLVHRDFKPHNAVLGTDGRVRVLDFGLAAKQGEKDITAELSTAMPLPREGALDTPLTETGAVMGTPAYMPPEQFMGGTVDHRSDQFSFCVALWEALYGTLPFRGDTVPELFFRISKGKLDGPKRSDAPAALRATLARGLKSDTSERWPNLVDLLGELERLNVDPARARRTRTLIGGVTVGGLTVLGGVLFAQDRIDSYRMSECDAEAAAELGAVWDDEARARVRDGLLATGVSFAETTADRALPWLDDYALAWQTARAEACTAPKVRHTWTDDDLDRARWCLEQRSMALAALVEQLQNADRMVVNKAVRAAAGLAPVDTCRDAALLNRLPAPPGPSERDTVVQTRQRLSKAGALGATGRYGAGLEVARAAVQRAESLDRPALLAAAQLATGSLLEADGKYEEAAKMLEDAYFEAVAVHDHETAWSAARMLVVVAGFRLAEPDQGARWARHAKAARDELAPAPDHPGVAAGLDNLAQVTRATVGFPEAIALHERALAIRERTLGPDHPDVAASLDSLAVIKRIDREYPEAKALHSRALAIRERALGPDHPDIASSVSNLANVYIVTGEYAEARDLHERGLAISENALRPDHPDIAVNLDNLAIVLSATGEHAEAKAKYERALAIREQALRPNHPDIANNLNNLAVTHSDLGNYAEAIALNERAVTIKEHIGGPNHADVANSLTNLAFVHQRAGEHAQAEARLRRALAIREKAWGPDHQHVAMSLGNLALVHHAIGEYAQAKPLYERALQIFDAHDGVQDGELQARFGAADVMVQTGANRQRAVALAEAAAQGYRDAGKGHAEQLAKVEAWLVEQRQP